MATSADPLLDKEGELSLRTKASPTNLSIPPPRPINSSSLGTLDMRAEPDAQTTVTDFLDFTEYLPADMMRSLTLIGDLDQAYTNASSTVHELTTKWAQLPNLAPEERPVPTQLRADISDNLNQALNARIYSHAEAVRMAENIKRHCLRAKTIHAKLQTILDNCPSAEELKEQKSPVATVKSPVLSRAPRSGPRPEGQRVRRPHVPRITVPGEVLAPYDLNYDTYSDEGESSSELDEDDEDQNDNIQSPRTTPGPSSRLKVAKRGPKAAKPPKVSKYRASFAPPALPPGISTSSALAQLQPPPENAVIGSADAPWGQLTQWELARLRKRMKKNAAWAPSDTMIARELKNLGRGVEAYNAAKQKADEEGRPFDGALPAPVVDPDTGAETLPPGALSKESLAAEEKNPSNRGMKLNEAKKLKRETLAKLAAELAAEEAEESARQMAVVARAMFVSGAPPNEQETPVKTPGKGGRQLKKRKLDAVTEGEGEGDKTEGVERVQKRTKTETPVPPPQVVASTSQSASQSQDGGAASTRTPAPASTVPLSTTPIPLPVHGQEPTGARLATSPTPSTGGATLTTTVPLKPAADMLLVLPTSPKKSTTPILPPTRETRKAQMIRKQEPQNEDAQTLPPAIKAGSRATTPASQAPQLEAEGAASSSSRRPLSRGKASSQEPAPSLAADRPRRTSTARNTPAPERNEATSAPARPASKRAKRPAPGVISRTNSGGNSAVTKRKAAPKKKSARAGKKDKAGGAGSDGVNGGDSVEVEVDDEGNVVDPDEPRYCLCNRVSFGTMIQCDNMDNCKQEWFHLECVGLKEIPARTTKWYCPDCRIALNIGEKGQVNSRGVRA